jgi:hypothetical protein
MKNVLSDLKTKGPLKIIKPEARYMSKKELKSRWTDPLRIFKISTSNKAVGLYLIRIWEVGGGGKGHRRASYHEVFLSIL